MFMYLVGEAMDQVSFYKLINFHSANEELNMILNSSFDEWKFKMKNEITLPSQSIPQLVFKK